MTEVIHLAEREETMLAALFHRCEELIARIFKTHDPQCFHTLSAKQVRLLAPAYEMMWDIESGGPLVNAALQDRLQLSGFDMPRGDSALTAVQFVVLPSTPYEHTNAEALACVLRDCWVGRVQSKKFAEGVRRNVSLCVQEFQQMRDETAA